VKEFLAVFSHSGKLARQLQRIWQPPQSGADQLVSGIRTMLNQDMKNIAASIIGALLLSTASVGAAVAPARALETAPVHAMEAPLSSEVLA
jgi:hypothetical protein